MDYRSRSRRLPRSPQRARRLQAGERWASGRDGYPDGEAAPVESPPGWRRQEAEGALLRLAGEAVQVIADALVRNDTSIAEWIVERSLVRHSKPGSPAEKSARMRGEDARAELERKIAIISARLEEERDTEAGPGAGEGEPLFLPSYSGGG